VEIPHKLLTTVVQLDFKLEASNNQYGWSL